MPSVQLLPLIGDPSPPTHTTARKEFARSAGDGRADGQAEERREARAPRTTRPVAAGSDLRNERHFLRLQENRGSALAEAAVAIPKFQTMQEVLLSAKEGLNRNTGRSRLQDLIAGLHYWPRTDEKGTKHAWRRRSTAARARSISLFSTCDQDIRPMETSRDTPSDADRRTQLGRFPIAPASAATPGSNAAVRHSG